MIRICRVSCRDVEGVEHAVEVPAESLYEAVARGLCALKANTWVAEIGDGLTTVTVTVKQTEATHHVKIGDFQKWLNARGKAPREMTDKQRIREILG